MPKKKKTRKVKVKSQRRLTTKVSPIKDKTKKTAKAKKKNSQGKTTPTKRKKSKTDQILTKEEKRLQAKYKKALRQQKKVEQIKKAKLKEKLRKERQKKREVQLAKRKLAEQQQKKAKQDRIRKSKLRDEKRRKDFIKKVKARPKKSSNTGIQGVFRAHYDGSDMFVVRAQRREAKISRSFRIKDYDGDEVRALRAAERAAKKFFKENPKYSRKELMQTISSRNQSGTRGIRIRRVLYRWKNDPKRISEHIQVEASWSPYPGVCKKKCFSVSRYGMEEAWRLAVKAREDGLRAVK